MAVSGRFSLLEICGEMWSSRARPVFGNIECAFERLEDTRGVGHRLTESTAMLERYLLDRTQTPRSMVPTTAEKLLYLERPTEAVSAASHDHLAFIGSLMDRSIHHGY